MEKTTSKVYVIRWSIESSNRRAEGLSSSCSDSRAGALKLLRDIVATQSKAFGSEPLYRTNDGDLRVMLYDRDGAVHRWWIEELDLVKEGAK